MPDTPEHQTTEARSLCMPGITVLHDPIRTVIQAAAALWPQMRCQVAWVPREDLQGDAHGHTLFPDDGGEPEVMVGTHLPLAGAVEVLAHELAHVAARADAEHGHEWQAAFSAIHAEYCRRVDLDQEAANLTEHAERDALPTAPPPEPPAAAGAGLDPDAFEPGTDEWAWASGLRPHPAAGQPGG